MFNKTELKSIYNALEFHRHIIELREYNLTKINNVDLNLSMKQQNNYVDKHMSNFMNEFNLSLFKAKKFIDVSKTLKNLFKQKDYKRTPYSEHNKHKYYYNIF